MATLNNAAEKSFHLYLSQRGRQESLQKAILRVVTHFKHIQAKGNPMGGETCLSISKPREAPRKLEASNTCIGEGNDTPLQYSCLENSMDGGAW